MIPQAVHRQAAVGRAAPGSEGHRLAADVRRARSDHRGLRRRRPVGRRARRRAVTTPSSRGASRAWSTATSTSGGRRRPACASRARRSARTAGCRSPTAGPADVRLACRVAATWETRRPLLPELALIAATIAYGAHVQDRAGRARPRHAGRASSCCASRSARSCSLPFALRRGWRRPGVDATSRRDFVVAALAFGVVGFAGYWFQNAGLATHDHVELRVHHRAVRRVHAADRDGRDAPARPTPQRAGRGRGRRRSACSCSTGASFEHRRRRRAHARVRVHVRRRGSSSAARSRSASIRSRSPPRRWRCSRVLRGAGRRRSAASATSPAQVVVAALVTGVVCSALAFTLQLWGQRYVEPSRAAVILLFEPVVAGFVGYLGRRAARRDGLRRRARDPRRHRPRRVARRGAAAPARLGRPAT